MRLLLRLQAVVSLLLAVLVFGAMGVGAALPGDEVAFYTRDSCCSNVYFLDTRTGIQSMLWVDSHDAVAPSWSPDGTQIVFWARDRSRLDTGLKLCIAAPDGTNMRCTDYLTYRDYPPTWSPDGTTIAYAAEDSALTLNANALDQPPASLKPGGVTTYANVAWSPDGSKMAYIASREGLSGIYVLDLETNESRWLADGLNPSWSPDGTQLAYHTGPDERVMTVPSSGGASIYIADGFDADWSPDGEWLAFIREEIATTQTDLIVRHLDSGREITLVSNGWLNLAPSWRPR